MSGPADHRFLEGSFAPVEEEITAFDLPVTGQVPAGLNGRYLRNGPNPLGPDDPHYHWLLAAYLSAHRTMINGSALCAALAVTERD